MSDRESIRRALETLPNDIFATYERILKEIPANDQAFAKTVLALICSDTAQIPTAEILVAACLNSVTLADIGKFSLVMLKTTCGSLISLSGLNKTPWSCFPRDNEEPHRSHRCSLAHYTVKEYLFSTNIATGEAKYFALSNEIVGDIDLKVTFIGLGQFGLHRQVLANTANHRRERVSRYEEYCLRMTDKSLVSFRVDIIRSEDLRGEYRFMVFLLGSIV
jgi:hypothetical protein